MLGIESPLHYVVEQMRLLNDDNRLSEWLDRAPESCGHAETKLATATCIDDVCKQAGKIRNTEIEVYGLAFAMASNLDNPMTREMGRAINAGLVDRFKDDFCMDPPSDGLKSLVPNIGHVHVSEPAMARTMLTGVAAFLGILAVRATQFSTGSFFLFMIPESNNNRYDGA